VPELPEVEALATFLREHAVGRQIARVDVAAISAVKTYDPPLSALPGAVIVDAGRHGKFLDLSLAGAGGELLHFITHLSRAGWLQWRDSLPPAPPRPGGKGPIAVRVLLGAGPGNEDSARQGFDLTEAGTQKRLAVYVVRDPHEVPGIARLGPDAFDLGLDELAARLRAQRAQLKTAIIDQAVLAGIGNAYSDEILHTAQLSPFKNTAKLTDAELSRLHAAITQVLTDAVTRSVGQRAATLKAEKRSGLRVHGRTGLPCPVCGDTVREVSFADRSFQYCPTCQTEGRALADRRLSRLIK
jgi:formamidopyrimidine-DNA glycosylase